MELEPVVELGLSEVQEQVEPVVQLEGRELVVELAQLEQREEEEALEQQVQVEGLELVEQPGRVEPWELERRAHPCSERPAPLQWRDQMQKLISLAL